MSLIDKHLPGLHDQKRHGRKSLAGLGSLARTLSPRRTGGSFKVPTKPIDAGFRPIEDSDSYQFHYGDMEWTVENPADLDESWGDSYEDWATWPGNWAMRMASASIMGQTLPAAIGDEYIPDDDTREILITGKIRHDPVGPDGQLIEITDRSLLGMREPGLRTARMYIEDAAWALRSIYWGFPSYSDGGPGSRLPTFRGLSVDKDDDILKLSPGDEFVMPLSAFTPNKRTAESFADHGDDTTVGADVKVVLRLPVGTRGAAAPTGYEDEIQVDGEWVTTPIEFVTAGRFAVDTIQWHGHDKVTISLRQTAVFDPSVDTAHQWVEISKADLGIPEWVWRLSGSFSTGKVAKKRVVVPPYIRADGTHVDGYTYDRKGAELKPLSAAEFRTELLISALVHNPKLTQTGRTDKISKPTRVLTTMAKHKGRIHGRVLHHGAGKQRTDTEAMARLPEVTEVVEYEPFPPPEMADAADRDRLGGHRYDTVVSNYVLNVLPPGERDKAAQDIADSTASDGVAIVTVRPFKGDVENTPGVAVEDGVITSRGTFQKGFDAEELAQYLSRWFDQTEIVKGTGGTTVQASKPKMPEVDTSYRIEHTAPSREYGTSAAAMGDDIYPDFWEHPEWYTFGSKSPWAWNDDPTGQYEAETIEVLRRVKDNPDALVRIYRSVPKVEDGINPGDWVTLSHGAAAMENLHPTDPELDYPVVSMMVRAGDVWTNGDSLLEWGYDPVLAKKRVVVPPYIRADGTHVDGYTYERKSNLKPLTAAEFRTELAKILPGLAGSVVERVAHGDPESTGYYEERIKKPVVRAHEDQRLYEHERAVIVDQFKELARQYPKTAKQIVSINFVTEDDINAAASTSLHQVMDNPWSSEQEVRTGIHFNFAVDAMRTWPNPNTVNSYWMHQPRQMDLTEIRQLRDEGEAYFDNVDDADAPPP